MYSENVLQQKKTMNMSKQLSKEFTKKHNNDIERKIIHQKAIFSIDEQPFSECHRDKITKFKNINEGKKLSKKKDQSSEPSEQELINHQNTPSNVNTLEITHTASQQDVTIDKSINFFDKSSTHPFNSNNSLIYQIHLENSTENSELDLAPIWNSNYLNNWSNMNNPVDYSRFSIPSLQEPNQNKNSTIFRPWDSLEAAKNITTINTSTTSNIFISSESTEEELCLESTEVFADMNIPIGQSNDLEDRERTINDGSLATYLKHEVRETELHFLQMLEQSIKRAYESYQRYDRQSSQCANKRGNENQKLNCSKQSKHPDTITEENLLFFQKIVKISEESYNMQQKEMLSERQTHQLSNVYTEPAPLKIKISPHYEIYLPRSTYLYIERKSEIARGKYDWRILVKETLLEVYGDNIKNYSAEGVRGGSPGINPE
ncbi:hypothetical protein KQX54_012502 [Cotesia glomerata]|uniref:Uncharacterized protein n=1 Tax=Cotesia glomerata TaxID=32391 RepID=A0AAV7HE54_COTGL|nr:hypothetical protein KQX54_012502 [Cotesia glomerata]